MESIVASCAVLSARSNHPERVLGRTLGAAAYMETFDPEEVVSRIQSLIRLAADSRELG